MAASSMPPFLFQVSQTLQRLKVTDSAGKLFPAAFFNSELHLPELTEFFVTTKRYNPGKVSLRMDCIASIRNRLPKLAKSTCVIDGDIAYAEWFAVFSSLSNTSIPSDSPGQAIEILLELRLPLPDSAIPVLCDSVDSPQGYSQPLP